MKCPKCGAETDETKKYCTQCGQRLLFTRRTIQDAIDGDQGAIAELYNATYNSIYQTVKSMIQDEDTVLDIVQDAYIKGFQSLDQLENPEYYCAWMKRVAVNKAKDWTKRKRPILFSELTSYEEEEDSFDLPDESSEDLPEVSLDQQETTRLINEILNTLPEDQRLVIGMYYYEEMSVKEISELLECSENTVKSRLRYARKNIEAKVLDLEKEGTKLYGMAPIPFLLWLLRNSSDQTTSIPSQDILQNVLNHSIKNVQMNAGNAAGTANQTISTITEVGENTAGRAAAGAGAKAAAKSTAKGLAVKIIAAAAVVAVVGGGAATIAVTSRSGQQQEEISSVSEVMEFGETISEDATPSSAESIPIYEDYEEKEPVVSSTPTPETIAGVSAAPTPKPDEYEESVNPEELYAEVLDEFYYQISIGWEEDFTYANDYICYLFARFYSDPANIDYIGYSFIDINQDGISELIIGMHYPYNDEYSDDMIYDLYTYVNGKIVHLTSSAERGWSYLCEDGTIYIWGTSSWDCTYYCHYSLEDAADSLSDLECVFSAADEEKNINWYYSTSGIYDVNSDRRNTDTKISKTEADAIVDSWPETVGFELTSFSNYSPQNKELFADDNNTGNSTGEVVSKSINTTDGLVTLSESTRIQWTQWDGQNLDMLFECPAIVIDPKNYKNETSIDEINQEIWEKYCDVLDFVDQRIASDVSIGETGLHYHAYDVDGILMLIVTLEYTHESSTGFSGNIYRLDLETGQLLSNAEIASQLNVSDYEFRIYNTVKSEFEEQYAHYEKEDPDLYTSCLAYTLSEENLNDVILYPDENGEMLISYMQSGCAGGLFTYVDIPLRN